MADKPDDLHDRVTRLEGTVQRAVGDITDANIRRTALRTEFSLSLGATENRLAKRIDEMDKKIDDTAECLQRIELKIVEHTAGMKPWEKLAGAVGLSLLGILSALILWKLGVK